MANFKVAYRVDMKTKGEDGLAWEPGCPVAFRAIQVSRNVNTADAFLQAEVCSVSGEEISSFKACFNVSYEPVAMPSRSSSACPTRRWRSAARRRGALRRRLNTRGGARRSTTAGGSARAACSTWPRRLQRMRCVVG